MDREDIFFQKKYRFHPALVLEKIFPFSLRHFLRMVMGVGALLSFMISLLFLLKEYFFGGPGNFFEFQTELGFNFLSVLPFLSQKFLGIGLICGGMYLPLLALEWFKNSYYYLVEALLERGRSGVQTPYTTPNYEVNDLYFHTQNGDLLLAFLLSPYGKHIILRSGLSSSFVEEYLRNRTAVIDFRQHPEIQNVFTLRDVVKILVESDRVFTQAVFEHGIRSEDLTAASEWVERNLKYERQHRRWWGRARLGQIRGFGADLSYGIAYALERFGTDLTTGLARSTFRNLYGSEIIEKIEIALIRQGDGNVCLVGEEGGSMMDVIFDLAHDIANGYTHHHLASTHLIRLEWKHFLSTVKTKQDLETQLFRMMNGAVHAGNVIIVIDDFPGFFTGCQAFESNAISILDTYTASNTLRFIVTASLGGYHQLLEGNGAFKQRFEVIQIPEPQKDSLTQSIEDAARPIEAAYHILFTYPAIRAIREGAKRYFVDAIMPDKAISLMSEIAPVASARGDRTVNYESVMNYIQTKTHIPVGSITPEERDRLTNLERHLQEQVIGQHRAIEVIANALRRSRAGVRNPNRPIGTFLFLGPTGVGKTEAAKALARVFFNAEEAMMRLDMSEFQNEDGLARLIGGPGVSSGLLANMLREKPYGVLLLDEFEKTHPKVLDLFLQIFDEGIFHDVLGKRVNAQNAIIIATSNAGASVIRSAVKEGKNLEDIEKEIIDHIVEEGKYKPELLNRFDGIVMFHPLTMDDYRKVALIMVERLRKRLREQNVDVAINEVLIEALLRKGVDPDFGARPMNRAVQEIVEQKIAEKIITGEVLPGTTVTFTESDFPDIFPEREIPS